MGTHGGRRRLLTLVGALLASAATLVPGGPARAASASVSEVGEAFQPAQVDIDIGDKVVWTNRSKTSHSVTFQNGPDLHPTCTQGLLGPVGCQDPGDTAERTFTAAGNYAYYCKLHDTMKGVVVVSPAAVSTTSTTAAPTTTTKRATTTTTRATSTTTATTRPLATSSTLMSSTTTATTDPSSSVLLPGAPPPFTGEGTSSSATGGADGVDGGRDTATVALIVALLLATSGGGGYLLWRLRPGRV